MTYGYCRCSTNENRQDIDRQRRELKKLGVKDSEIYFEYESGSKADRIELDRLLSAVKSGDTIAVTEVSRLTRSTKQLCEIIELAKEKRLELIIGTFRVDCRKELDPMTHGMIMMWGVFSELERNMISQRVKSGMENAKAKGTTLGRPATSRENLPAQFLKYYDMYRTKKIKSQQDLARLCGLSRPTVSKYLKIIKKTDNEIAVKEWEIEEKRIRKEEKQEQERLKNVKRMTDEELEAIARDEDFDVYHNGVSEFTPATRELERRRMKWVKADEARCENADNLDLSLDEYDV